MKIGGLNRFSLIDYPGHVAAVLFTQGCNFRCPYCHNPELVYPDQYGAPVPDAEIEAFLQKRRGQLDGIVLSGGEPTLHSDLPELIAKIRWYGYKVKLDTNGTNPDMLGLLLKKEQLDFVAMDIKAPMGKYALLSGVKADTSALRESIAALKTCSVPHEFRITLDTRFLTTGDLAEIYRFTKPDSLTVNPCQPQKEKS
ncbi:MAG: anaerobic ribonucleoside-triphosphate reductase activating protein [Elusimicrobiaceae bacterium]|nr:anaerobic ribonucleoside-triphosphate reductase activating protein [Elusimicrobiaceae bacterium]